VRKILDRYGYVNAEHHLNEWNLWTETRKRDLPIAAAKTLGFMLMMQDTSTDVMCYYDAGLGYSAYRALINPDNGYPYRNYYAFMMFNTLYTLKNQVESSSTDTHVFVQAAIDGRRAAIVLSNTNDDTVTVSLDVNGFDTDEVQVLRIDEENRYTLTGETIDSKKIVLPPCSCVEIKLFNLE